MRASIATTNRDRRLTTADRFDVEFRRASQWPRLNSFGVIAVTVSGRLSLLGSTSSSVHNDAAALNAAIRLADGAKVERNAGVTLQ